jgi:hypothetical protein
MRSTPFSDKPNFYRYDSLYLIKFDIVKYTDLDK